MSEVDESSNMSTITVNRELSSPDKVIKVKMSPKAAAGKNAHPLIYGCAFCGVRFSSPSTLEAHQTFYCTKVARIPLAPARSPEQHTEDVSTLPNNPNKRMATSQDLLEPSTKIIKREVSSPLMSAPTTPTPPMIIIPSQPPISNLSPRLSSRGSSGSRSPASRSPSAKMYECGKCTFKADTESAIQRHMVLHGSPAQDGSTSGSSDSDGKASPKDNSFCKECNIQFTSYDTFQAHKMYYCGLRRMKQGSQPSPTGASPAPPTLDISNLIPGHPLLSPGTTITIATPTSTGMSPHTVVLTAPLVPGSGATVIMQPVFVPSLPAMQNTVQAHQNQVALKKAEDGSGDEQPLDLSIKKAGESPGAVENVDVLNLSRQSSSRNLSGLSTADDQPQDLSLKKSSESLSEGNKQHTSLATTSGHPGSPTGIPSPIQLKAGMCKCVDCNIVFYKFENYVAHKQFYCSERHARVPIGQIVMPAIPAKSPNKKRIIQPSSASKSEDQEGGKSVQSVQSIRNHTSPRTSARLLQYLCEPCKIRFSSMDTLDAHKQFYCPYRETQVNQEATTPDPEEQTSPKSAQSETNDNPVFCRICGKVFASKRQLTVHACLSDPSTLVILQCPYCDYIGPSDNRLIEHMKAHEPSKVFKCTLCGYRGNTVRGMRMHGRMHIENGEEFTDENMAEFEEPPQIPKQLHHAAQGPIHRADISEEELLRLKNEPYKRRKSRKAYEKVDDIVAQQNVFPQPMRKQPPHECGICGEVFPDTSKLRQHVRSHEVSTYTCKSCDFKTNAKCDLVHHVKITHEGQKDENSFENGQLNDKGNHDAEQLVIKIEPELSGCLTDSQDGSSLHNGMNMGEDLQSQERAPTMEEDEVAESSGSPTENNHDSLSIAKDSAENIKMETLDEEGDNAETFESKNVSNSSSIFKGNNTEILEKEKGKKDSLLCQLNDTNQNHKSTEALMDLVALKNDKNSPKYCKQCDITFLYLATFIAHKKYYCKALQQQQNGEITRV
ncbi:zinc finger protein ush isoform X2 [Lingula anatina]|nr:zinc finger protein ush isoform X2 [Lingula anatina]|eukprot:XP_013389667.1 zinc finger protein ush isoform X2 [Lingula anatina]